MKTPKFKSINDFLDYLPPDELKVTLFLRDIVKSCLPQCTEKLSYNVPYFYVNKSVCFIWPGSILWGNKRQYNGVRFGFTRGNQLSQDLDYFKLQHRKFVSYRDFTRIEEVDVDLLKAYLFEAAELDQALAKG